MAAAWALLGVCGGLRAQAPESVDSPPPQPTTASAASELDAYQKLVVGNNEPGARRLGATYLLAARTPEATERLAALLRDDAPDAATHIAICRAIAEFDAPPVALVEPVLARLGDAREGVDEAVRAALHRFEPGPVFERLGDIAAHAQVPMARRVGAIKTLGEFGDEIGALGTLAGLLKSAETAIRDAALSAFRQASGIRHATIADALSWWQSQDNTNSEAWLRRRAALRAIHIQELERELVERTRRLVTAYRERYFAASESDRPAMLLSYLNDGIPGIRELGLDLVNILITDRREVGAEVRARLVEMVGDSDSNIRMRVAKIVGDLRLAAAAEPLIESLGRETDERVRHAEVAALGLLDVEGARPVLESLLTDASPLVAGEAALSLGRMARRQNGAARAEQIAQALITRYSDLPAEWTTTRDHFLTAMAQTGEPAVRALLREEAASATHVGVRRVAIDGLASFGAGSADAIAALVDAEDAAIRLAAVRGLGRASNRFDDLAHIEQRFDPKVEESAEVREAAWEAYVAIAERLEPARQFALAAKFERSGDMIGQRRRLGLLRSLRGSAQRFERLSPEERFGLIVQMGDAQMVLGAHRDAAASFETAMGMLNGPQDPRYPALAARRVSALLRAGVDDVAFELITTLRQTDLADGEEFDEGPLRESVLLEIRRRIDAGEFPAARTLIERAVVFFGPTHADMAGELERAREELELKIDATIAGLLDRLGNDPEAAAKLRALPDARVLRQIHTRLSAPPTTTAPAAAAAESQLIALAREIAPAWPGYDPAGPSEARTSALTLLEQAIKGEPPSAAAAAQPVPQPTTQPTTRPAEGA